MKTMAILSLAVTLAIASACPVAAQSGTQLTPDGKRALVSKDIGGQRWAISRNADGTVTGNVFFPGGGAPQFVFCTQTGASLTDASFSCSGADACPLAVCEPDEWLFIADVTLPLSFFGSTAGSVAWSVAREAGVPPSIPKSLSGIGQGGRPAGTSSEAQPSGIQITPNGAIALISKDVGDQRWAITRNDDGTVTGNVFFPGGGAPQFVWCEPTGTASDPLAFRCLGAAACAGGGGCASTDWTLIAEVMLPASFFRARDTVSLDVLADVVIARYGEVGGFDAVFLALDRGYSLRQVARAVLSGRLQASGAILERSGELEPAAGPALGLFAAASAATGNRVFSVLTLDDLRAKLPGLGGRRLLVLLLSLIDNGYPPDQIVEELLLGSTVDIEDFDNPELVDQSGNTIRPRAFPQGVGAKRTTNAVCSNGVRETGEGCDLNDLGGATCDTLQLPQGRLVCTDSCTIDSSQCVGRCGNNVRESQEQCDGTDFGTTSCETLQLPAGTLACNDTCKTDFSGCRGICGNSRREGAEQCDGDDRAGETCQTLGMAGGALSCTAGCTFNTNGCVACATGGAGCCPVGTQPCGSGCIPAGADCCGANGLFCEAGRICVDEGCCPAGFPVVCGDQCFPPGSGCCGNGVREAGEACDGADVGGATCPELGSVRCTSSCALDTSSCESRCPPGAFTCGNSCAPNGADCCDGTSVFCDGGDVCAFGGGGAVCCPGSAPTLCAGTCYPAGIVCCGSYACAGGSVCLGNNQCG